MEFSLTIVPGSGDIDFIIDPFPEYITVRFFNCFLASDNSKLRMLGTVVYFVSYQNLSFSRVYSDFLYLEHQLHQS